jgi:ribosome biogenesis protein BMS1
MEDKPQKAHRPSQSGVKADKKADKKGKGKQSGGFNEKVRFQIGANEHY